MKKVLLALLVIVMLGYSAFSIYFVFGLQKTSTVEESVSEVSLEEAELAAAYAEVAFQDLASEYCESDGVTVTEAFLKQITELACQKEAVEALIQALALRDYTADQVCSRIFAEPHETKEHTIKLMVVDEDQYTAANLCSGVLDILKNSDLSEFCSGMEIQEVGTEEYRAN